MATFHQAISQGLRDQAVHTMFGVIGDGNLFIVDSFRRLDGTRYLPMATEAGAVEAAFGFAHVTGELGVATVTHGPGLTNTVTALVEGVRARIPLLLIAGDTGAEDRDSLQNIPQREVASASGAGFEQLRSPRTIGDDIATAIRRAHVEARPIVLNVPADFQWQEAEYVPVPRRHVAVQAAYPDADALDAAVGIIASARRPVVLAGRGAIGAAARAALVNLAGRIQAPLATTLKAKDLFRGEPHDIGIFGTLSHEVALETINRSDCVVAFGASMNRWTAAGGSLLAGKRLVQVDVERGGIGRYFAPDAAVAADAATTATAIAEWLDKAEVASSGFASADLARQLTEAPPLPKDRSTGETLDIHTALTRLDEAIPARRILVYDAGRFMGVAFRLLHVPGPGSFIHTVNQASIGLSVGTAVGAAIGAPGPPAVVITGDGGFMLGGLAEFATAARLGVDLIVVVLNDGAYGAEHIQFTSRAMDPSLSILAWPDFAAVADALGGRGYTLRSPRELDLAGPAIAHRDRPVLFDIRLDPRLVPSEGHLS
ncbi:MAG TPA: thiamine pyrophosphate-dependent enzyme [Streptosporangiaceae bacterium]